MGAGGEARGEGARGKAMDVLFRGSQEKNGKRDPPVPEVIIERLFWLVKRLPLNINMKWIR
jgi:hypothetical protein